jgi:GNAT superfamily N-acetyltransferase
VRDPKGAVVAMASAQLVVSTAEGARSAWIEDVVVADGLRGKGIGAALLAALLDWARDRGATRAQLLADRANVPALEFYRRLGWQPTQLGAWRISL